MTPKPERISEPDDDEAPLLSAASSVPNTDQDADALSDSVEGVESEIPTQESLSEAEQAERARYKGVRVLLRRIVEHVRLVHLAQGVQESQHGFTVCVTHEQALLNYVTPRKNTAWLPDAHLVQGIQALRAAGKPARVWYADGLFPPSFARTLRQEGLTHAQELPLMVYQGEQAPSLELPDESILRSLPEAEASALWARIVAEAEAWQVHQDALAPSQAGLSLNREWLAERHGVPIAALRLTTVADSAHMVAWAWRQGEDESLLLISLACAALNVLWTSGCRMAFVVGGTAVARAAWRRAGWQDAGSIVVYSEPESQR